MRKMCTIVATVLGSSLLLLSIVFIGASSRLDEGGRYGASGRYAERHPTDEPEWELVSAGTVAPPERMVHYDELRREHPERPDLESLLDDELDAQNSQLVVQVYSLNQKGANYSVGTEPGPSVHTMKVHKYGKPKEPMDGRATDRVERKVFAPVRNIQEQMTTVMESSEAASQHQNQQQQSQQHQSQQQHQPTPNEALLQERFYVDDSVNREPIPAARRRHSNYGPNTKDEGSEGYEADAQQPTRSQAPIPPFFDYNEPTSQRMLDEFFALRNQDSLASRRSNYDWDEGQFRSRTLDEIKSQNRAPVAASRKKAPVDYSLEPATRPDADMDYDRYAEYAAEMEQRMAGAYGTQKLGRKQRATHFVGDGSGRTHVLNRTPIVSTDGDGSAPLLAKGDGSARSRFHYSLPSMVYNPYAWEPYHFNMLRFPQCNACQQNARALCGKCGLCADCCAHSKCTCGCLHG